MKDRKPPWRFPLYMVLCVLLATSALLTSKTLAQTGVVNPGVFARMAMMSQATTAIETLASMMAGRNRFDRTKARIARRKLIAVMRSVPSAFTKPHNDPLSRARPEIWTRWDDFETRAGTAKRAAKRLNVDRLEALRSTLPDMINACLGCHRAFRNPR